ncbi:MAG TPA: ABC transporter substrate-binding protein [Xanthobacteraceae bacterium]|jgi:putative ABC transport system substrate-binding protein
MDQSWAMQRRVFISVLGGAIAWAARPTPAQPGIPVIGFLNLGATEQVGNGLAAFRNGLSELGLVEGRNVALEYRFADNRYDRLPELAADLVRHQVAVIVASNISTGLAAKAATSTIPVVFFGGTDPVQAGLVASLNRPGGNVTGISSMNVEPGAKRLGLLHELLPAARRFGALVRSGSPLLHDIKAEIEAAAATIGAAVEILPVGTKDEIDTAFMQLAQKGAEALVVIPSPLFSNRRVQIVTLAASQKLPAIYFARDFAEAGGLMSYGSNGLDAYRQLGIYVGRILKGEKPAELPVMQAARFEFVINLQTAKTLGIKVPPTLLALSDDVIE